MWQWPGTASLVRGSWWRIHTAVLPFLRRLAIRSSAGWLTPKLAVGFSAMCGYGHVHAHVHVVTAAAMRDGRSLRFALEDSLVDEDDLMVVSWFRGTPRGGMRRVFLIHVHVERTQQAVAHAAQWTRSTTAAMPSTRWQRSCVASATLLVFVLACQ